MLLNRIELQLPKDDHVKYDSRARKLDWDQIKFKDYSAEDCKKYWEHIQVAQDTSYGLKILAGADPAVPYSSRDDPRCASLVEPTLDQLLQVKGKSNNFDEDKKDKKTKTKMSQPWNNFYKSKAS